jgi:hypothetical protein
MKKVYSFSQSIWDSLGTEFQVLIVLAAGCAIFLFVL